MGGSFQNGGVILFLGVGGNRFSISLESTILCRVARLETQRTVWPYLGIRDLGIVVRFFYGSSFFCFRSHDQRLSNGLELGISHSNGSIGVKYFHRSTVVFSALKILRRLGDLKIL